jgi:hypothetical protein
MESPITRTVHAIAKTIYAAPTPPAGIYEHPVAYWAQPDTLPETPLDQIYACKHEEHEARCVIIHEIVQQLEGHQGDNTYPIGRYTDLEPTEPGLYKVNIDLDVFIQADSEDCAFAMPRLPTSDEGKAAWRAAFAWSLLFLAGYTLGDD